MKKTTKKVSTKGQGRGRPAGTLNQATIDLLEKQKIDPAIYVKCLAIIRGKAF